MAYDSHYTWWHIARVTVTDSDVTVDYPADDDSYSQAVLPEFPDVPDACGKISCNAANNLSVTWLALSISLLATIFILF